MKFSLILPTLNRCNFIKECLDSLVEQKYKNFEVIIIDQSYDELTKSLVEDYKGILNIIYKKVSFKGLSKARNVGIKLSNGSYIVLLDDDARYSKDYLEEANKIIDKNINEKIILSGKIIDDSIDEEFVKYGNVKNEQVLNKKNIFKVCLSAALIIDKKDIMQVGGFDERLGVGAFFGSAEESDLIFNLIDYGYKIIYSSKMIVYHLKPKDTYDYSFIKKKYSYALGLGAFFKKHIVYRKNKELIPLYIRNLVVPTIKIFLNINNRGEVKKNKNVLKGHIKGFIMFKE
ncbi:glycosyltransferase [Clostridium perfringens]|nr:glycosyltransferase [Clostridium perfringens]